MCYSRRIKNIEFGKLLVIVNRKNWLAIGENWFMNAYLTITFIIVDIVDV